MTNGPKRVLGALLSCLVGTACFGGYDPDNYGKAGGIDGLTLALGDSVLPADGATTTSLVATVPASDAGRIATLVVRPVLCGIREVPAGGNTLSVNDSGTVRGTVVAGTTVGTGEVMVGHNGLARIVPIRFVKAWPEQVLVAPERFSVTTGIGNQVKVVVQLLRTSGTASTGIRATIEARDTSNAIVGLFDVGSASGADGAIDFKYTAGTSPYLGPVTLHATVDTGGGSVTGTGTVVIVP